MEKRYTNQQIAYAKRSRVRRISCEDMPEGKCPFVCKPYSLKMKSPPALRGDFKVN